MSILAYELQRFGANMLPMHTPEEEYEPDMELSALTCEYVAKLVPVPNRANLEIISVLKQIADAAGKGISKVEVTYDCTDSKRLTVEDFKILCKDIKARGFEVTILKCTSVLIKVTYSGWITK